MGRHRDRPLQESMIIPYTPGVCICYNRSDMSIVLSLWKIDCFVSAITVIPNAIGPESVERNENGYLSLTFGYGF